MTPWLARWLYSALLVAATPLYLLRLWWRGRREPGYRWRLAERLGWYSGALPPSETPVVWVHAVSLGETRAAAPLVAALRARLPRMRLVLTHHTATGREAGRPLLSDGDVQTWLPYDTPGATRRFLRRHRPAVGVLMETEIWPNLLASAEALGVPMVLANARLSERSERRGQRLAALLGAAVRRITRVLAQSEADARRFEAAGAPAVEVCGNLKYDVAPMPALLSRGRRWRERLSPPRPVVLAASTREGEEPMLLAAWRALPAPRPLLVVVPRHPQRFNQVALMAENSGFTLVRRSDWTDDGPPPGAGHADVWLGDTMGEMPVYYAMADVALLGGSFAPLGGQNLIEAAACGCPIVMGPHTFNFDEAAELSLRAGASVRVAEMADAVRRAAALAVDPQRHVWVANARAFSAAHRGATATMAQRIAELAEARR